MIRRGFLGLFAAALAAGGPAIAAPRALTVHVATGYHEIRIHNYPIALWPAVKAQVPAYRGLLAAELARYPSAFLVAMGIRRVEQAAAAEHRAGECAGGSADEVSARGHVVSSRESPGGLRRYAPKLERDCFARKHPPVRSCGCGNPVFAQRLGLSRRFTLGRANGPRPSQSASAL